MSISDIRNKQDVAKPYLGLVSCVVWSHILPGGEEYELGLYEISHGRLDNGGYLTKQSATSCNVGIRPIPYLKEEMRTFIKTGHYIFARAAFGL